MRLAIQQRAALVPVLCMGELDTLRNLIDMPHLQVWSPLWFGMLYPNQGQQLCIGELDTLHNLLVPNLQVRCLGLFGWHVWGQDPYPTLTSRQGGGLLQAWTYKKLGFPVPYLVVGRWGVTPFPAPTPMRFIVGEPLSAADAGSMVRRPPCMLTGTAL